MRLAVALLVCGAIAGLLPALQAAEEPLPPAVAGRTDYDELAAYGNAVRHVEDYLDNYYLYTAAQRELLERAPLAQDTIQFNVEVLRVTPQEVIVQVDDAGETRVLLQHCQPPLFGNLQTVSYYGSASTLFYNQFAKPVALRIGSEIPLAMAATLRKHDQLLMQGQIGCVQVAIGPTFNNLVVATIVNWVPLNVVEEAARTSR